MNIFVKTIDIIEQLRLSTFFLGMGQCERPLVFELVLIH